MGKEIELEKKMQVESKTTYLTSNEAVIFWYIKYRNIPFSWYILCKLKKKIIRQ